MPDPKDRSVPGDLVVAFDHPVTLHLLVEKLAPPLLEKLLKGLRPFTKFWLPPSAQGIRVLSPREVAEQLDVTESQLPGLEAHGRLPCRRRIGQRRTGYLSVEVYELPVNTVLVQDGRTLSHEAAAFKLGMDKRTVTRMVRRGELPRSVRGRWSERDLDRWLLRRPKVRSKGASGD